MDLTGLAMASQIHSRSTGDTEMRLLDSSPGCDVLSVVVA